MPKVGKKILAAFVGSRTWYAAVVVAAARGPRGAKTVAVRVDKGVYGALHPARKSAKGGFDMAWDVHFVPGLPLAAQPCLRWPKRSASPDHSPTPRGEPRARKEKARSKQRRRRRRRCERAERVPRFINSLAPVCPAHWLRTWMSGGAAATVLPTLACVSPTLGCALYAVRAGVALATLPRPPTAAQAKRAVSLALRTGISPASVADACKAAASAALTDSDSGVRRAAKRPATMVTVSGTGPHATVALDPRAVKRLVPLLDARCQLKAERGARDLTANVWLVSGSLNGAVYELAPDTPTHHAALLVKLKGRDAFKLYEMNSTLEQTPATRGLASLAAALNGAAGVFSGPLQYNAFALVIN